MLPEPGTDSGYMWNPDTLISTLSVLPAPATHQTTTAEQVWPQCSKDGKINLMIPVSLCHEIPM